MRRLPALLPGSGQRRNLLGILSAQATHCTFLLLSVWGRQTHLGASGVNERRESMFLLLAIILVILWAGGFFLFHVTSFMIHLLIIFAVISLVFHFIGGGRRV